MTECLHARARAILGIHTEKIPGWTARAPHPMPRLRHRRRVLQTSLAYTSKIKHATRSSLLIRFRLSSDFLAFRRGARGHSRGFSLVLLAANRPQDPPLFKISQSLGFQSDRFSLWRPRTRTHARSPARHVTRSMNRSGYNTVVLPVPRGFR